MSLCLHTGAYSASEAQIRAVRTPAATETWMPVAHHQLLERVHEEVASAGMRVSDQALALYKDGARMFGYLEVVNGHNQPDYNMVIGLRNSHDQSFPVGLAVGHRVFVCDYAESRIMRSRRAQAPEIVAEAWAYRQNRIRRDGVYSA